MPFSAEDISDLLPAHRRVEGVDEGFPVDVIEFAEDCAEAASGAGFGLPGFGELCCQTGHQAGVTLSQKIRRPSWIQDTHWPVRGSISRLKILGILHLFVRGDVWGADQPCGALRRMTVPVICAVFMGLEFDAIDGGLLANACNGEHRSGADSISALSPALADDQP